VLARFTEGTSDYQSHGDRALGLWLCPHNRNPGIYFSTYDTKGSERGTHIPIDFSDFDGSWNFFHFTYSYEEKKASMYIKFGFSGNDAYYDLENVDHFNPSGYLKFVFGQDRFYNPAIGSYFGVTYGVNQGLHKGTKDGAIAYLK
jgi:hypothetical protein